MIPNIYNLNLDKLLKTEIKFNDIQEASKTCFIRAQRFVGGYNVENEIIKLCEKFFGNTNVNQKNGLVKQYNSMREEVIKNNKIGLVLIGMNLDNTLIDSYPTIQGNIIDLTVKSITRILIRDYFNEVEINDLCKKTPNFHIYYNKE